MKKILSVIVSLVLMLSLCITANAASGTASLNGNGSVTVGSNIVLTVNVSGCGDATSVAASVNFGSDFEYVSASWVKSGSLNNPYDSGTKKGALGGLSSPNVNGDLYKITLKAKTASTSNQTVSITIIAKNGSSEIMNTVASKQIKINCATHSYGAYSKINDTQHTRTCSVCGNVETTNHSWNAGTIDKNASCKETGNKKYTCTACSAEKNETIAKTNNHSFGNWAVTKKAGCTTTGTESRTCSVCNKVETRNINATGHSFGGWSVTEKATCTATGTETRKCSSCNATESRTIKVLGHSFSNPTVTKEPTCTETGVESGKCTRCGETTTNTIKAKGHKFGNWKETKAATCTEKGIDERKCSACQTAETREVDALGHDFENPTVVKEATISSTGLMEGKCKRCGETTSEIIPCTAKDETTGTVFETEVGVFQEGTQMTVKKVESTDAVFETVKTALEEVSDKFEVFDISAVLNGTTVQPNGKVKVTFNIPEGFSKNIAIYFISIDGATEKINSSVDEDGKTITAELSHFSSYAIVDLEKDTIADTNVDNNNTENNSNMLIWIIIALSIVIIAGAVVTVVIIKKKKKSRIKY